MKLYTTQILLILLVLGTTAYSQHHSHHGHENSKKQENMGHEHGHGEHGGDHWMAPPDEIRKKNPIPSDSKSIQRGNKLFQTSCISCHGNKGKGDGPAAATLTPKPADLTMMSHPDGDFAWKIANGKGAMPAWKNTFSEDQIWDLVNFIQTLSKVSQNEGHGDHGGHMGHGGQKYMSSPKVPLKILKEFPTSGKARETTFDDRSIMESTGIENELVEKCAHGSRAIIMLTEAEWKKCGGAIEHPKTKIKNHGHDHSH